VQNSKDERMATARHRVQYHRGTRLASSAEIDLVNLAGETRTSALEPILKFQMKGLGYGHPEWGRAWWKGRTGGRHERSIHTSQLDPPARARDLHVQQEVHRERRHEAGKANRRARARSWAGTVCAGPGFR
jgi:hypothetical protein